MNCSEYCFVLDAVNEIGFTRKTFSQIDKLETWKCLLSEYNNRTGRLSADEMESLFGELDITFTDDFDLNSLRSDKYILSKGVLSERVKFGNDIIIFQRLCL